MRATAWVVLLFSAFGFFAAIMGVINGADYQDAVRVDGTVTALKKTYSDSANSPHSTHDGVSVAFLNPFNDKQETFFFEYNGSVERMEKQYPIASVHNVWVTKSGLRTCRAERPDRFGGAPVLGGFGVVMALLAGVLFRVSRRA